MRRISPAKEFKSISRAVSVSSEATQDLPNAYDKLNPSPNVYDKLNPSPNVYDKLNPSPNVYDKFDPSKLRSKSTSPPKSAQMKNIGSDGHRSQSTTVRYDQNRTFSNNQSKVEIPSFRNRNGAPSEFQRPTHWVPKKQQKLWGHQETSTVSQSTDPRSIHNQQIRDRELNGTPKRGTSIICSTKYTYTYFTFNISSRDVSVNKGLIPDILSLVL